MFRSFYRAYAKRREEQKLANQIVRLGKWYEPLHGDTVLQTLVDEIIQGCGISLFVETGTFVGDTSKYIALRHPNLKVLTCEINHRWLKLAKRFCQGIDNIEFFEGQSPLFLQQVCDILRPSNTHKALFLLDAHWNDYWPLFDETKIVSSLPAYVVFIDDFEVPDKPIFHYDNYQGIKNCLATHAGVLGDGCYVPNYDPDYACKSPSGYGVFFKNVDYTSLQSIGYLRKLLL